MGGVDQRPSAVSDGGWIHVLNMAAAPRASSQAGGIAVYHLISVQHNDWEAAVSNASVTQEQLELSSKEDAFSNGRISIEKTIHSYDANSTKGH